MKRVMFTMLAFLAGAVLVESSAVSQPPEPKEGGKGAKGGEKGPPPRYELGQLFPPPLVEELKLSDAQAKELESLQKDVKAKLEKLLTAEQKKTVEAFRPRGGPGGPGGEKGGKGGTDDKGGKYGKKPPTGE